VNWEWVVLILGLGLESILFLAVIAWIDKQEKR